VSEATLGELLDALASGRRAVMTLDRLARRLNVSAELLGKLLEAAEAEGKVCLWPEAPAGPSAILSAAEARRRGLVLYSLASDPAERYRWIPKGQNRPERARSVCVTDLEGENGRSVFDEVSDYRYRAMHFLSFSGPWEAWTETECPYHNDAKLPPLTLCLYCLKGGFDDKLPHVPRPRPRRTREDQLKGGLGT
jgi:hypothetical protein